MYLQAGDVKVIELILWKKEGNYYKNPLDNNILVRWCFKYLKNGIINGFFGDNKNVYGGAVRKLFGLG